MKKNGWLVLAAFLVGILLANLSGKELLTTYGIMNTYFFHQYSYQAIDNDGLFGHVLSERLKSAVFLFLLGKVMPGKLFFMLVECFAAAGFGFLLVVAITNLGMSGVALILGGMLPQWIFYVGAFLVFAFYRLDAGYSVRERKLFGGTRGKAGVFVLVILLLLIGIVTESYLNPIILDKILKNF